MGTPRITHLLDEAGRGNGSATAELVDAVYAELQAIAGSLLSSERRDHTLQASDLVHEAWLRLVSPLEVHDWPNRRYFYYAAAEAMRRVLTDHARKRSRRKRGSGRHKVTNGVLDFLAGEDSPDFLEVEEAVQRLEEKKERLGRIVRLRFYAGLSVAETAEALGVSEGTVVRDWTFARAWLYRALGGDI